MANNICIITGNWEKSNKSVALSCAKLIDVILPNSDCIFAIVCNHTIPIKNSKFSQYKIDFPFDYGNNFFKSFIYILIYQLEIINVILATHRVKKYDTIIFCFGADLLFIPMIFARITGKNVIIRSDGILSLILKNLSPWKLHSIHFLEMIGYRLSCRIATEVLSDVQKFPSLIKKSFAGYLYIEDFFFQINPKPIEQRKYTIGVVSRFSAEKGIIPLANAIKLLEKKLSNKKVIFIGEGPLQNNFEEILKGSTIDYTILPWLPKEKLPEYLDEIKLLVLGSEREGLPNIILEAMACGTPVLTTSVGAVPEFIRDGETGFILENNSPECIARNIMRSLSSPELMKISKNGRRFVEENFTFDKAANRWKEILDVI